MSKAQPIRITTAGRSRAEDIAIRQKRYAISMSIRSLCFIGAVIAGLDFFDEVATYDALPAIAGAAIVDFSGNEAVLASLRERSPPVHLCRVGLTHGRDEPAVPRSGEQFFFAPDAIIAVAAELGPAGFDTALASATRDFIDASRDWLAIETVCGAEAVRNVWGRIRFGDGDPTRAIVASL